ncbi:MAG: methyltransferase [Muribaculaceae bacterium]|nr:methyltransferase [Muribaculaceae bacterium]
MADFHFKQFDVDDRGCGMKVCSDSVLLGAWFASAHPSARTVADVGAGSGILALICAQCCPEAHIHALELDSGAAEAAVYNFGRSPWADRLEVVHGDFSLWQPGAALDLIISNPPYFTTGETAPDAARAAARHQQGLSYASLIAKARLWLAPDGHLGMVSPADIADDIIFAAEMAGLKLRRRLDVVGSPRKAPTRTLWDFAGADGSCHCDTLMLRRPDGTPTEEYIKLVEPFYTKI